TVMVGLVREKGTTQLLSTAVGVGCLSEPGVPGILSWKRDNGPTRLRGQKIGLRALSARAEEGDGLGLPLEADGLHLLEISARLDQLPGAVTHEDLARTCQRAQPRGDVHCVADARVFRALG